MLQDIRKSSQGTAAKVIIGLIVISFAGFGLQSILLDGGRGSVAEVNGEAITPMEFEQALNTQQRRLASMMGEDFDPALLDPDRLKPQVIDSLVTRKLMLQSAKANNLAVSEREIGSVIAAMPQFQQDGKFSPELYRNLLANAGYSPTYFKESLRSDLLLNQMRSGLTGSEFVTDAELAMNTRVVMEQRDVAYFTIPSDKFADVEAPAEQDIQAYYDAQQAQFMTPETVDLDYILLTADALRAPVDEKLVREAYELESQDPRYATQNRIAHILIEAGDNAQDQLAEAQKALATGESFADVAKRLSADAGSANDGGDLGFSDGSTFPEAMEAAASALPLNQVSEPIVTDAGTHLLVVTERRAANLPSFEDMRESLEERVALEEANAQLLRAVEDLSDLVFNADSLEGPARELGVSVSRANAIERGTAVGLFSDRRLNEAAFSSDVLEAGHNSEVIELGDNQHVVLRVREHHEPELLELDRVRDAVVSALQEEQRALAMQAEVDTALADIRGGEGVDSLATQRGYEPKTELGVTRLNTTLSPELLRGIFTMARPASDAGTSVAQVPQSNGDVAIVQLTNVAAGTADSLSDEQRDRLKAQVRGELGGLIDNEYLNGLREGADISGL